MAAPPPVPAAPGAVALGHAVAEHEGQQAVVVDGAVADVLAVGIDRLGDAVERAVHRDVLDPADGDVERGVPGAAKLFGLGVAAQLVGAVVGAADPGAGAADAAGLGQGLDEGQLHFGPPAVDAVHLARDGGEAGQHLGEGLRVRVGGLFGVGRCDVVGHGAGAPRRLGVGGEPASGGGV